MRDAQLQYAFYTIGPDITHAVNLSVAAFPSCSNPSDNSGGLTYGEGWGEVGLVSQWQGEGYEHHQRSEGQCKGMLIGMLVCPVYPPSQAPGRRTAGYGQHHTYGLPYGALPAPPAAAGNGGAQGLGLQPPPAGNGGNAAANGAAAVPPPAPPPGPPPNGAPATFPWLSDFSMGIGPYGVAVYGPPPVFGMEGGAGADAWGLPHAGAGSGAVRSREAQRF